MRNHLVHNAIVPAALLVAGACGNSTAPFRTGEPLNTRQSCSIEFFDGGPGADGIPALVNPPLEDVNAGYLPDDQRVLGVERNGVARAYPFAIMWWHEVANDTVGGVPLVITYCPLTGSGLAFHRVAGGEEREFGVSGLILENNLTLFDRESLSLWHQLSVEALCGPATGTELERVPLIETTWGHWKSLHPNTTVLGLNTGVELQYGRYPYGDYDDPNNDTFLFPGRWFSPARPPKELVLGVAGGKPGSPAVAYPFGVLASLGSVVTINDALNTQPFLVIYEEAPNTARALSREVDGQTLTFTVSDTSAGMLVDAETGSTWNRLGESVAGPLAGRRLEPLADAYTLFWFAWSVFHPLTRLYL